MKNSGAMTRAAHGTAQCVASLGTAKTSGMKNSGAMTRAAHGTAQCVASLGTAKTSGMMDLSGPPLIK